jgi:hypothetical protein
LKIRRSPAAGLPDDFGRLPPNPFFTAKLNQCSINPFIDGKSSDLAHFIFAPRKFHQKVRKMQQNPKTSKSSVHFLSITSVADPGFLTEGMVLEFVLLPSFSYSEAANFRGSIDK